jgi:hypothetical protein
MLSFELQSLVSWCAGSPKTQKSRSEGVLQLLGETQILYSLEPTSHSPELIETATNLLSDGFAQATVFPKGSLASKDGAEPCHERPGFSQCHTDVMHASHQYGWSIQDEGIEILHGQAE